MLKLWHFDEKTMMLDTSKWIFQTCEQNLHNSRFEIHLLNGSYTKIGGTLHWFKKLNGWNRTNTSPHITRGGDLEHWRWDTRSSITWIINNPCLFIVHLKSYVVFISFSSENRVQYIRAILAFFSKIWFSFVGVDF